MDQSEIRPKTFTHDKRTLLNANWLCLLTQGVMMIVVGALAVALPPLTALGIHVIIGWLLMFAGVWRAIAHIRAKHSHGFGWYLAISIFAVLLGATMLIVPVTGMKLLTGILFAFFVIDGIGKVHFAMDLRTHSHEWVWAMTAGALDLSLAVLLLAGSPGTAPWAIGLLVGINMMYFGIALIATSLAARRGRRHDLRKISQPELYVSPQKSSSAR